MWVFRFARLAPVRPSPVSRLSLTARWPVLLALPLLTLLGCRAKTQPVAPPSTDPVATQQSQPKPKVPFVPRKLPRIDVHTAL